MKKALLVGIVSFLFASGPWVSAGEIKIGYVNLQRIKETDEWKRLENFLKAELSKSQLEVEQKKKELETLVFQYERQKPMLSESAQREKEREIQRQRLEYQLWTQDRQRDLDRRRDQMTQDIWSRVNDLVEKIAKEKGLTAVLDYDPNPPSATVNFEKGIVYLAPEVDITDEMLRDFNALFKGKM